MAEIDEHLSRVKIAGERCKADFLPILREHGIIRVEIDYDGGGDEGSVGAVTAYAGEEEVALPETLCDHHSVHYGGDIQSRAVQLEDAMSSFADNAVCTYHSGWENGEGAYGTVTIDVPTGTVRLSHHSRFIDYDTTETEL